VAKGFGLANDTTARDGMLPSPPHEAEAGTGSDEQGTLGGGVHGGGSALCDGSQRDKVPGIDALSWGLVAAIAASGWLATIGAVLYYRRRRPSMLRGAKIGPVKQCSFKLPARPALPPTPPALTRRAQSASGRIAMSRDDKHGEATTSLCGRLCDGSKPSQDSPSPIERRRTSFEASSKAHARQV